MRGAARPSGGWAGSQVVLKDLNELGRAPVGALGCDAPIVEMTRDASGLIISVNDAIVALLGWQPEQVIGSPSTNLIHPVDQPGAVAAWMEMITAPGSSRMWRGRYKTSKGSWKWVETENRFVDGSDPRVLTSMREVSSQEASLEEQFQAREQLLAQLSDALPVGVFQGRPRGTRHPDKRESSSDPGDTAEEFLACPNGNRRRAGQADAECSSG